ncbi:hypothetical protein Goklo_004498 [Gossypium klotzschianum]|uniref:Uncharacterized protein n=1 Tax=Gossypium klotzschianum TaxID=34286 RepID=A0A7J8VPG9_9ROSI|nr:hypothetical protein [Gossypium klotzschianum]
MASSGKKTGEEEKLRLRSLKTRMIDSSYFQNDV